VATGKGRKVLYSSTLAIPVTFGGKERAGGNMALSGLRVAGGLSSRKKRDWATMTASPGATEAFQGRDSKAEISAEGWSPTRRWVQEP